LRQRCPVAGIDPAQPKPPIKRRRLGCRQKK
jgi:hypothetical protein